jgi:hypothetical protein
MAPEPPAAAPAAPPAAPRGGGGNVFTRKIGPMPMWAWVAIIAAVLIGYAYWRNKQSAASSSTAATAATGTDASQVPQFVNQTYTTVTPPVAGPPPPPAPPEASGGTQVPGGAQIPGHHVVTATGTETLAQIAKKYGTSPADIISFTKNHKTHISATESKFLQKGKGRVPRGLVLWVPEPQVPAGK